MPPEPPAAGTRLRGVGGVGRRRFLLLSAMGAAGAVGLGAGAGFMLETDESGSRRYPRAEPGTIAARSRFLQIVAHEDDDLLFMTPDLLESLRAGSPHLTVYLSAGESKAGIPPDTHDVNAYVAEREKGLRTAYAFMLGEQDRWRQHTLHAGPLRMKSYTLAERDDVQLVFLMLADGRDPRASLGWHTLGRLWKDVHGAGLCGWTQAPAGSAFRQCLSREDVLTALGSLLERFRPTVVRAQDTAPDRRYAADHPDHIAAAHFADEAVRRYTARHPDRFVLQQSYRDYNIRTMAVNLSGADRKLKQRIFSAYARHDYRISSENPHWDAYEARMAYRWPRGSGFVTGTPGRASAYAVGAGRLVVWTLDGRRWRGPQVLGDPGGPLTQGVSAVAGSRVFGLRADTGEVVAYIDGGWQRLGRPDPPQEKNLPGAVVAAVDGSGVVGVFVRNGRGGVSARYLGTEDLDGAAWSREWADLPGLDMEQVVQVPKAKPGKPPPRPRLYGDVQDGMAAVVTEDGRIELYAATRSELVWWRQPRPGAPPEYVGPLPVHVPIAPLAAVREGGQTRVFYREAWTGRARVVARSADGDTWGASTIVRAVGRLDGEPPAPVAAPEFSGQMIGPPAGLPGGGLCVIAGDGRLHVTQRAHGRVRWRPEPG